MKTEGPPDERQEERKNRADSARDYQMRSVLETIMHLGMNIPSPEFYPTDKAQNTKMIGTKKKGLRKEKEKDCH